MRKSGLSFVIFFTLLFAYPLSAVARLEGAQKIRVQQETYKSCIETANKSSSKLTRLEKQEWCNCYAYQVINNTKPHDIEEFSARNAVIPTARMRKVANDAIEYCKKNLIISEPSK